MGNGDTKIIRGIAGHDMMRRHLAEMGFVTGEPITMISQYGGNVILQVKGFRVALDKKLARRIIV
ncbi:MAG: ferrous iron transport protein A [Clostridia bacterium]|jgi:ferrous iron transport protein A|nr:ferrous iron transport protein A [Clostridia bacterium]